MAGLDSLATLQEELQRIGENQLALRSAIDNDKAIVLHPSQQVQACPPTLEVFNATVCMYHPLACFSLSPHVLVS